MSSTHNIANSLSAPQSAEEAGALVSRELQKAHARKRATAKAVSLAGTSIPEGARPADPAVLARRKAMDAAAAEAAHSKAEAFDIPRSLKTSGTYDEVSRDGTLTIKEYDGATPERINQARAAGEVMVREGRHEVVDPFTLLANKGLLDKDPATNRKLWDAGEELRRCYYRADLGGVKAMNLMKDIVDGGVGDSGCPISDHAFAARRKIRDGYTAVGNRLLPYLTGVVLEDRTVESLSGMVQDSASDRLRYVIAMERLRAALDKLCEVWNIQVNDKSTGIQAMAPDTTVRNFERRQENSA